MKILRIEICNIASIGAASLDFTEAPLANAPLILVAGTTGSGKSTILDAVCLALYGNAPRLSDVSGNRKAEDDGWIISNPLHLVRQNSDKCFSKVTFEANNGRTYTAEWSVSFYSRGENKGEPKNIQRTLTDVETEEVIELKLRTNLLDGNEFIGLTYDQFRKTSLLAQGEFNRFLKGNSKEKSSILERLVGVEIFNSYGDRIKARFASAKTDLEIAEREVKGIELLPPEEVDKLKSDIETSKAAAQCLQDIIKEINAVTNWYSTHKSIKNDFEKADVSLKKAEKQLELPEVKEARAKVNRWDELEEMRSVSTSLEDTIKEIGKEQNKITRLGKTRNALLKSQKLLSDRTHSFQEKLDEIDKNLKLFSDSEKVIIENSSLVLERLRIHHLAVKLKNDEEAKVRKASGKIDEHILKLSEKDLNERTEFKKSVRVLSENHDLLTRIENLEKIEKDLTKADTALKKAVHIYNETRNRYEKVALSTKNAAKTLRASLVVGENCPVCGSTVSELLVDKAFEDGLKPLKEEFVKAENNKTRAENNFFSKKTEFSHAKSLLPTEIPNINILRNEIDSLASRIKVSPKDAANLITQIDDEIAKISDAVKKVGELNQAKANLEIKITDLQKAGDRLAEFLNFETESINHKVEEEKIEKLVKLHSDLITDFDKKSKQLENLSELSVKLTDALTHTQTLHVAESGDVIPIEKIEKTSSQLIADFNSATDRFNELTARKESWQRKKAAVLAILPDDLKQFADNPSFGESPDSIKNKRELISRVDTDYNVAKGAFDNAKESLEKNNAERPDTELSEEQAILKKEEFNNKLAEINRKIGSEENRLKANDIALEKHESALERVEKARTVYADWKQLDDLLGGEKFKLYVCSELLSHLIGNANHYFLMFQKRYKLEVSPGNFEIMVYDNELHLSRVFSSLSGGETFMVSLSLALGLAALSKVRFTCDTLFIDEGFGTLSSDCLDSVMNSLDMLRRFENRRVIVISHVEMLRDRIPVQILVKRNGSKSSLRLMDNTE